MYIQSANIEEAHILKNNTELIRLWSVYLYSTVY